MCERAHTHLARQRPDATPPSPSLSLPLSTHTVVHSNLNVTTFRSPAIRYHLLLCSSGSVLLPLQGEEGPSERKEGTWASPRCSFFVLFPRRRRAIAWCRLLLARRISTDKGYHYGIVDDSGWAWDSVSMSMRTIRLIVGERVERVIFSLKELSVSSSMQ